MLHLGASENPAGLESAPDDIHHLLLSQLADTSPSAIFNLAQSSKTLRAAALPIVYRKLILNHGPKKSNTRQAYTALVEKFRTDNDCEIAKHVRSITVKSEIPPEDLMLILNKISEHGNLLTLNWKTAAHMSRGNYDKLHSTWPKLEISVTVVDRQNVKSIAHRQMDMRLLSSPLLTRLTYVVYNQGYQASLPSRSEWPKLTRALVAGGNVRVLRIQSQSDGEDYFGVKIVQDSEPEKLARLDLVPAIRLPQLEELSINSQRYYGASTYLWDTEHCLLLRDAMDWSRLRKLDFGADNPDVFFTTFTSRLPSLKSLRFEVNNWFLEPAVRFIESIDALESIHIDEVQKNIQPLWPAIMQHKASLKKLIFGPTLGHYYSTQHVDLGRLEEIVTSIPGLEHLGWDMPCEENIDPKHITLVSNLNLQKLDIFFRLPDAASDFSDMLVLAGIDGAAPPSLDKERSKKVAMDIFESVSKDHKSPLEWLTLHISRIGYHDRAEPYLVQAKLQLRKRRDVSMDMVGEQRYETRGAIEWRGLISLEEELSLEEP
ncbi:hypothetical protein T440DRAFT_487950 [Plenodomus tracheiphilus IPT5]|uniref:Uncharacterized protein n=1 Tax=Plenodomus tracheiphilus IPT5 TaxID=1408161 RepID=A0A6A7BEY5_9PLEO|nr:hypothetical protein T440DRAFT_487950 [Plenodomus tracheiphilus IPT5]